jgi:Secretion system C-terminal sorting domain
MLSILQTARKISFWAFILGVCLVNSQTAFAQKTWTGGGGVNSNVWSDPSNWSGNAVPVAADEVVIPDGVTVRVTTNAVCRKLQIAGGTGRQSKLLIEQGVTLTANATDVAATGGNGFAVVTLLGGMIENNGILSIAGRQNLDAIRFDEAVSGAVSSTYMGTGTLTCNTSNGNGGGGSGTTGCSVTFAQTSATAIFTLSNTGVYNFSTGVTLTQGTPVPFPTTKTVFYCAKGNATINGTVSIAMSGDKRPIRVIGSTGNSVMLTIESGVTMQLTSTMGNPGTGIVAVESIFAEGGPTLINKGTLNFSGAKGNPIGLANGPNTLYPATFINEGTININGDFTDATTNVTMGGIHFGGSGAVQGSIFTNARTGVVNYNTNNLGTSVKPLFVSAITSAPKCTITNNGTITVGTNGVVSTAIKMGDSKTVFNNAGTLTIGRGNITSTLGLGFGAGTSAVFNNNAGGILNFTTLPAASTATDSITFANAGGTLSGSGVFSNVGGNTFTSASIISPGQGTGAGIFTFGDASLALMGTFNANVNGKTTAGTDFDQINAPTAAVSLTGLTIVATTNYAVATNDVIVLIKAASLTGTPTFTLPRGWVGSVANGEVRMTATSAVGVNETLKGQITLSPNPTSDKLRITLSDKAPSVSTTISVYDLVGRLVLTQKMVDKTVELDMSSLAKGTYLVKIDADNRFYTEKITKQ